MAEDGGFEDELNKAFEDFTKFQSGSGTGGFGSSTVTGRTAWDFFSQFSNPELKDMIEYLERNGRNMQPQELVNYHIKIITYFQRLSHLKSPSTKEFDFVKPHKISALYDRQKNENNLEDILRMHNNELGRFQEGLTRSQQLFDIFYEHLYIDKNSLVSPEEREALLTSSAIKMRAYRIFLRESKGEYVPEEPGERQSSQLISLRSGSAPSPNSMLRVPISDKVTAYIALGFFIGYFEREIKEKEPLIHETKRSLEDVRLSSYERATLSEFEHNHDRVYSPANYWAAYNSLAVENVKKFLKDLHKSGVKVNVNVNF